MNRFAIAFAAVVGTLAGVGIFHLFMRVAAILNGIVV